MKHTLEYLRQKQSLDLEAKAHMTRARIRQWYEHYDGQVYVAFSGGKDSTVLLHIIREIYPDTVAVFGDTGLEYPEIRDFVKTFENVVWLKPKMNFREVIKTHGYPVVTKEQAKYIREVQRGTTEYTENKRRGKVMGRNGRPVGSVSKKWRYLMDQTEVKVSERCCDVMKKRPFHQYQRQTGNMPFIGTMAADSKLRQQTMMRYGCNGFDMAKPQSRPMMFWLEEDVWEYIKTRNLPYSKIYDMGYERTGCMWCMFGAHLDPEPNRFQQMQKTHPKQWRFCLEKLGLRKVLKLIGVPYKWREPEPKLFE